MCFVLILICIVLILLLIIIILTLILTKLLILIDNFYIALFSDLHKLTALYKKTFTTFTKHQVSIV